MASTFSQIETLKQQLAQLSVDVAEVQHQVWDARKAAVGAKLRAGYFWAALVLREPSKRYSMWSTGVLIVGPAVAMLLAFVFSMLIGLPGGLIFWIVVLKGTVALAILTAMLNYPATAMLPKLIADERFLAEDGRERVSQRVLEAATLRKQQVAVKAALRQLIDEDHRMREALLGRNWKAMRDDEWKLYIGEVFAALGADVEKLESTDESHGDFVVTYGNIRVAAIARGNCVAVTNRDVQAAVAVKFARKCDRATVISNSRLAHSALDESQSSGCILIGVKEFPAFVMGSNLELFKQSMPA